MNIIKKSMLLLVACVACLTASAQGDPIVKKYTFADHSYISRMSDNGLWAVTSAGSQDITCTPKLIDLNSSKEINIGSASNNETTCDVTNDGTIVVGASQGKPAYWSKTDGQWHTLELKSSNADHQVGKITNGIAVSVTPDGKYAVGEVSSGNEYAFAPAMWDLSTGKTIMTANLPKKDMAHIDQKQMQFNSISSDGRYILATMSASYLPSSDNGNTEADLGGLFNFIYDIQKQSYNVIGFTESDTKRWTPDYAGCFFVDAACMSNNGKYVTGTCRIYRESDSSTDYYVPYLYDVEKDLFTAYEDEYTKSNATFAVSNDGIPLMSSPEGSPYRNWYIYDGSRFWYAIQDVLMQRWGTDLMGENGYDNTGTADGISDNGMRIIATPTYLDGDSYVLDIPEPISSIINEQVNMLGSYTSTPSEGSKVSYLTKMSVTFTQSIKTVAVGNVVTLETEDDKVLATATKNQADGDGNTLNITFRKSAKTKLEEGHTYYIHIPANTVAMTAAMDKMNDDIYIRIEGRRDGPVACTKISPSDGTAVAKVDINTNPITLDFDTEISIKSNETRKAHIYRNDETEPYAELNFYYGSNQVALAPSTTVNLYKENTYRVVVPAGIITDVSGNGANEEISFTYKGAYERTVSYDDANLFKNDFDSRDIVTSFMLFDGDQKTPSDKPKAWNFNYSLPWYFARTSNTSTDYAAVSHSMYSPAGRSDDWMVVPQLYIPDGTCELEFESQSYLKSKDDYLKIYVWACDNVYNALNKDIVSRIKSEGDLVYDKLQDPGATEEGLEGEWTSNTISLEKYAGKNIYIAFYNDNEDQSAVFVNNLYVKHNMPVLISFDNEESIVEKTSVNISGSIAGNLEDKTITEVTLTLVDSEGKTVDTKKLSGLKLSKGIYTKFAFDKPLTLKEGVANKFKVLMNVEGKQTEINKTINHLLFQPVKRVVLEEFTGRDCSNCPLGIVTIDNLRSRFGDKFLPIAIHGYTGDPLGNGFESYYGYLGLNAAPSARINRSDSIISPMVSDGNGNYYMSVKALEAATGYTTYPLWSDYVESEMKTPTISDISATISYDANSKTFSVPTTVRYAMNAESQNLNIFTVLVEQEVPVIYQQNGFSSIKSDILLPWSQGGDKAKPYVTGMNYDDVCRATWGSTFLGNGGLLPSTIDAGEEYKVNDIKITLKDLGDINPDHCQAIVMLFDANTGKYINAVRTTRVDGKTETGIGNIMSDNDTQYADNAWYTISGAKMSAKPTAAGIYIHHGKKVTIK